MNSTTGIFSTPLVPLFDVQTARVIAALLAENKRLCAENEILRKEKETLTARLAIEVAKRFGSSSERRPAATAKGSDPAASGLVPAETSQRSVPVSPKPWMKLRWFPSGNHAGHRPGLQGTDALFPPSYPAKNTNIHFRKVSAPAQRAVCPIKRVV
jgi:hypothetical protein